MTKEELKKLSNDTFFDNNEGLISPDGHRRFNTAIIDTMAEETELRQLADPLIPHHARPLVIDEIIHDGLASWNRSPNHVAYAYSVVRFPIGDITHHYSKDVDGKTHKETTVFGPAVRSDESGAYFVVTMPGRYVLFVKQLGNIGGLVQQIFDITPEQAATEYRINYEDVTPGHLALRTGKHNRSFARLYYVTNSIYESVNYEIKAGTTFKYTRASNDIPGAIAGDKAVGVTVHALAVSGPMVTRQRDSLPFRTIIRPELNLRHTFAIESTDPIAIGLFLNRNLNKGRLEGEMGKYYEVWFKKAKTWHHKDNPNADRITRRIVGYVRVIPGQKMEQIAITPKWVLMPAPSEKGFMQLPQFVDFQIRMKNNERTVVAQYRATKEYLGNNKNKFVFRRI